ncbi:MAG: DCC1-like thiol-disulfide oxidoreductase family protein [Planctomycetes bacterium]|nr:DCC1-like thiol-disulfide oxidoreductase family protein [Planctomycetota bacterium]
MSTSHVSPPRAREPLLLYDGECGLCARSVQWVLERDPSPPEGAALRFAPLQGPTAAPLLARHGIAADPRRGFDSLVLVLDPGGPEERALTRSEAALAIGRYLGGRWAALARLARLVPRALRDLVYALVARNRLRLFGGADACRVPRGPERGRFLP